MTSAFLSLALFLPVQAPGPLDAYLANYSALRVELDYQFRAGQVDFKQVDPKALWSPDGVAIIEDPMRQVVGSWAYDGTVARYKEAGPAEAIATARAARPGELVKYVPDFELLFDGNTAAWHYSQQSTLHTALTEDPPFLALSKRHFFIGPAGPFLNDR